MKDVLIIDLMVQNEEGAKGGKKMPAAMPESIAVSHSFVIRTI